MKNLNSTKNITTNMPSNAAPKIIKDGKGKLFKATERKENESGNVSEVRLKLEIKGERVGEFPSEYVVEYHDDGDSTIYYSNTYYKWVAFTNGTLEFFKDNRMVAKEGIRFLREYEDYIHAKHKGTLSEAKRFILSRIIDAIMRMIVGECFVTVKLDDEAVMVAVESPCIMQGTLIFRKKDEKEKSFSYDLKGSLFGVDKMVFEIVDDTYIPRLHKIYKKHILKQMIFKNQNEGLNKNNVNEDKKDKGAER